MISSWRPKEVKESECKCDGIKPGIDHTCGIYAYKKMFSLNAEWALSGSVQNHTVRAKDTVIVRFRVHGSVWMWGDIIEHSNGYRAQYAYPCAFILPTKHTSVLYGRLLRKLARLYGIPVVTKPEDL